MLKLLFSGIIVGVGVMIGIGAIGVVGASIGAQSIESAINDFQIEASAPVDNLEAYRACLHMFDLGDVSATVDACRDEYADWLDSPTFSEEFTKLRRMDSRVEQIMAEYRAIDPDHVSID